MNHDAPAPKRPRLRLPAPSLPLLAIPWLVFGCANPLEPREEDFVVELASPERLHSIEPVSLAPPPGEAETVEEAAAEALETWAEGPPGLPPPERADAAPVPLTLADVRAAALENNLDLAVALFDPSLADTVVDEERARFDWTFNAAAGRSRIDAPTASTLVGSKVTTDDFNLGLDVPLLTGGLVGFDVPFNETETNNPFSTLNPAAEADLRFSFSQPLLRDAGIGVNTHGIRVAGFRRQIAAARTKLEAIRVLAGADRVYWNLYAARESLRVRQEEYELAVAQLARARRLVDAGEVPAIEVLRAQSGVAQRLEDIIVALNEVRDRQRDLLRIMNRPDLPLGTVATLVPETEPAPVRIELDADRLAALAVERRMEMLEQELELAVAASAVDFARNQTLPLVVLDYTYNVNGLGGNFGNAFDLAGDKRFEDYSYGLRADVPVGNEAAEARLHRAILERVQRLATREQRRVAIRQEVFDAVDQLDAEWQRILAARQAAILAGRTLEAEQRQFDVGLRTSTDVLDAATALRNAQLAEIRAVVAYQIAQIDVAFATGTLLGHDRVVWTPADVD